MTTPCEKPNCTRSAAVRVYSPWDEDCFLCLPHARAIAAQDGVVAEVIEGTEDEWS